MIEVAIMGHGVVGSGAAGIITTHKKKLFSSIGEEIHIKHILDLREFPDSPLADRFTKDFEDIINFLCLNRRPYNTTVRIFHESYYLILKSRRR